MHGAQDMEVVRNVAFEILGHSIYLEDGTETNNLIQENLVFTTREGFVDRTMHGDDAQDDTPASYWISNPQNRKWCIFDPNLAICMTTGIQTCLILPFISTFYI